MNDDATGMLEGMKASVDRTMSGIATDSANALLLKRIPQCLTVFFAIPQISSSPPGLRRKFGVQKFACLADAIRLVYLWQYFYCKRSR